MTDALAADLNEAGVAVFVYDPNVRYHRTGACTPETWRGRAPGAS
jgi:hypothetical protein